MTRPTPAAAPAASTPAPPPPAVERDSAAWWAALRNHDLVVPRCGDCRTWRWPPRALCHRCGSLDWALEPVSGRGTVASWIVNRHGFGGAVPTPSTVLLVRLAEQDDLLLPGGWAGPPDGAGLRTGLRVEVGFADHDAPPGDADGEPGGDIEAGDFTLLRWHPANEGSDEG